MYIRNGFFIALKGYRLSILAQPPQSISKTAIYIVTGEECSNPNKKSAESTEIPSSSLLIITDECERDQWSIRTPTGSIEDWLPSLFKKDMVITSNTLEQATVAHAFEALFEDARKGDYDKATIERMGFSRGNHRLQTGEVLDIVRFQLSGTLYK